MDGNAIAAVRRTRGILEMGFHDERSAFSPNVDPPCSAKIDTRVAWKVVPAQQIVRICKGHDARSVLRWPYTTVGIKRRRARAKSNAYVVAMREDHPAAQGFTLEAWLSFPHIVISRRGEARTALDSELAPRGLRRRIGVVVPTFRMVVPLLRCTAMIGMVSEKLVGRTSGLAIFKPHVAVPDISLSLAWHRRRKKDSALRHVADRLAAHFG
jgi:LysR substrate binding domain